MSGNDSALTSGQQITLEQSETKQTAAVNEAKTGRNHLYDSFPKLIHEGRQGKHILGHNNYKPGRSYLNISIREAQELLNRFSGYGQPVSDNRERVDFGCVIGYFKNPQTDESLATTMGIIHYSKDGAHIVPSHPR